MRFRLNLERHCIETETRKLYNARIRACLQDPGLTDVLEPEIQVLQQALETLDFSGLRARFPELQGGGRPNVCLNACKDGRFTIEINGTEHAGNAKE